MGSDNSFKGGGGNSSRSRGKTMVIFIAGIFAGITLTFAASYFMVDDEEARGGSVGPSMVASKPGLPSNAPGEATHAISGPGAAIVATIQVLQRPNSHLPTGILYLRVRYPILCNLLHRGLLD